MTCRKFQHSILVVISLCICFNTETISQIFLHDQFPNLSFDNPVGVYEPGDGTNRLFVLEQDGVIRVFQNDSLTTSSKVFLDIRDSVIGGNELGLLGLAFHPQYATNGYFYVDYTIDSSLRTIISRFHVSVSNPDSAERNSEVVLIEQDQPFDNHNGGQIAFGPDGYLYIAFGDGGSGGDPFNNGQSDTTLLGKILRINVDSSSGGKQYSIPPDNPYYNNITGYKQEIFAKGMRNPWRFSFDQNSTLWVADVGQNKWEEIDTVVNGGNYGWNIMEGKHCYSPPSNCDQTGLHLPLWDYFHDSGRCSITGGFVYRGNDIPSLYGKYLYSDACSGEIWSLSLNQVGSPTNAKLLNTGKSIVSFGVDKFRESYVCSYFERKIFKFSSLLPQEFTLIAPPDEADNVPIAVNCQWSTSANATKYHLQVATDSIFSSLIVNDSTIQDTSKNIGSLAFVTKYYWRVRALNDLGASTFTGARTFTTAMYSASYDMMKGWNLISLPLDVSDSRTSVLFPSAISNTFDYTPIGGYEAEDTLVHGVAYWIKFNDSTTVGISGSPRSSDTLDIVVGWNMIGAISEPVIVDSVVQQPPGILISSFYQYVGSYIKTSVLEPAKGYWVKASAPGKIILHTASASRE